ncbi:MAG: extracellular solute-binding protein [Lachnospiraceae bacterium]|nr:extracellular solute-binding protein [Lachnospiraceae bacterium]
MKKRVLTRLSALVTALLLILSACHGQIAGRETTAAPTKPAVTETAAVSTEGQPAQSAEEGSEKPTEPAQTEPAGLGIEFDTNKKITVEFWAKNDSNPTQIKIYNKAKADFEALYPNVTVTIRFYSDYAKIYQDVITNIATNTTPNVCISYPDHIATYLKGRDMVVALDDYMADPDYGFGGAKLLFDSPAYDEVIGKFLEEGFFSGHQYDLPFMRSSEALYINKTYVEAMGYAIPDVVSWDWIWEVSEKAMEKDGDLFKVNGQKIMIPFIYKSTDNMMIQMLKQKGAGYALETGEVQLFNDTTKELLYTIYEHVLTRAFSTFKIDSYPGNFFNAGRCLFAIDSTAGATWLGSNAPLLDIHASDVVQFETAVRPIPQFDTEHPQMISQGPSLCIFNKSDEQEVLASWLFAQYLLTNDVQVAYAKTEGYVPVTYKAQDSAEYKDYVARAGEDNDTYYDVKIAVSQMVIDNMENTFITPVFAGSASVRDAAGTLIENVAKATRRKQIQLNADGTALDETYLENLFKEVRQLYKLNEIEVTVIEPEETDPAETGAEQPGGQTPGGENPGGKTAETPTKESKDFRDLGPLPATSVWLLGILAAAWVVLGLIALIQRIKSGKNAQKH